MKKWAASLVPEQSPDAAEPKRRFAFWH